jgi:glutamate-5-semialdehyde dehydrogenase
VTEVLDRLEAGMAIPYGGNRVARVGEDLAAAFQAGDRLVVVQTTGDLLHIPLADQDLVQRAVEAAHRAFLALANVDDLAISAFYESFAARLEDSVAFAPIASANEHDVASARERGRSTTRLELTTKMRADMIAGLRAWRDTAGRRDELVEEVDHGRWRAEIRRAPLGVVGFVFEGRPNVFADATGVLRTGNAAVFRIGSDALGTARAIVEHALAPALETAGLPAGSAVLLDTPSRAAGWGLFDQPLLSLAVARGSGEAVEQLGAVARQAGIPVSLHGTGGAWIVAGLQADATALEQVVYHSLDRKVCNSANVICVPRARAAELVPSVLAALDAAGARRGADPKLHVDRASVTDVPAERFDRKVAVQRADGVSIEPHAEPIERADLGREWEWEDSPEVSLCVTDDVAAAVELFNAVSPRLAASLVSNDPDEHAAFWATVDAPFVGNGFTRWVDGQFALGRPELGLSNWQHGRLFARSGVLSGDSVYTLRVRAVQHDADIHR